jgi:hypothetical protein
VITDKSVKIKVRYPKKFKDLGYDVSVGDIIYLDVEKLNSGSHIKVNFICDYCGKKSIKEYRQLCKYLKHNCNNKDCISKRIRDTNREKYGVDNVFELDSVKNKIKNTNLEKYGVDSYTKTSEYINKTKLTNLKRYGSEYVFQSDIFFELSKKTCLKKYGVTYYSMSTDFIEKIKSNNLEKYGVEYVLQCSKFKEKLKNSNLNKYGVSNVFELDSVKNKIKNSNLNKYGVTNYMRSELFREKTLIAGDINYLRYLNNRVSLFKCDVGHEFEITSSLYHSRYLNNTPLCTVCNPIGDSRSIKEKELYNFIKSIYGSNIVQSYRDDLEIDIYLPELKLGFEFNGLYWHSELFKDKNYHLDKTNHFKERGIRIIHIWEDDWVYKREIIESQISSLLGLSTMIFARKCEVREIKDSIMVREFLMKNHLQGFNNFSALNIGLFYNNEIVSIATFDHFEGRKRMLDSDWNLSRFCNLLGTIVVGGASKILKYFINKYKPKRIISYADKSWSEGNLYKKIGFNMVSESISDYKYIVGDKRIHKSRFRKDRLGLNDKENITESEVMINKGVYRLYDCGKIKFEFII